MDIIYNGLRTPDGTVLESLHRHDCVTHVDKNGKTYLLDGGLSYVRYSCHGDEELLTMYDTEPHAMQRLVLKWGTYGINGDQPLKRVTIASMSTDHLRAVMDNCDVSPVYYRCMTIELFRRTSKFLKAREVKK